MPCTGSACDRPPRPADPGGGSSRPRRPPRRAARWPACGGTARPNWPGRVPRRRGPGSLTRPTAAQRREAYTYTPPAPFAPIPRQSCGRYLYKFRNWYVISSEIAGAPPLPVPLRSPAGQERDESHIIAAARYEISHFTVWRFDEHYVSLTRIDRRCIWRVGARDNRRARRPARRHDS